ncbi:hypothetical protein [Pseudomonas fulva]|uniref:hypothetical protein n=1 Tax=Pseudomonas fulva TaxID=47880 RepID=UPI00201E4148|nr:hypothetical protein [Pseudomonas fulva]
MSDQHVMQVRDERHRVMGNGLDALDTNKGEHTLVDIVLFFVWLVEVAFIDLYVVTHIQITSDVITSESLGHFQGLDGNTRYRDGIE